ncbi:MAG: hypothetical protein A3H36_05485 [Chloroflexi bacterium RIFCSPLOWO2_02_FULL_71_16]|nr:MAG: hypothetical protein A3H36_05485 [Chloroflexi bacterium RIFCSPLOWO2_02_FULL_71_16]
MRSVHISVCVLVERATESSAARTGSPPTAPRTMAPAQSSENSKDGAPRRPEYGRWWVNVAIEVT